MANKHLESFFVYGISISICRGSRGGDGGSGGSGGGGSGGGSGSGSLLVVFSSLSVK